MPKDPRLNACLIQDRYALLRQQRRLKTPEQRTAWEQRLEASCAQVTQRRDSWPRWDYPDLPVSEQRETIKKALSEHQVVVIAGETGSGKTTQLPKICLELGLGARGLIGHTQPRRLAARSVAERVAEELSVPLGEQVGYQVRFQDQRSERTLIKLMTDGILLAETQRDPYLNAYEVLIIDEAHERSLNIDFLLGYIKRILPKRPDLKVIITSATIDVERFAAHFNQAPVIQVSGRTYPVEMVYRPLVRDDPDSEDLTQQEGVAQVLREIQQLERERGWQHGPRDVLVFLSGEREIRELAHFLRRQQGAGQLKEMEILPLYARLPATEQHKVFHLAAHRRVILSTNVAETSLTVPGIRYVIDTGVARMSRYSYRAGVQRLPIEPIARASARQRAGRCGRITEGVCFRLYSEEDYLARPEFTEPEIRRTNLAAVILQLLALRLGHIEDFPFVEAPDPRFIKDGLRLLFELGAVDQQQQLTSIGRQMARLPIDPRLAKMLLQAHQMGSLHEVLILVSVLNLQDPRERPAEKQQAADQAHSEWKDEESDFVALLNLWQGYEQLRQDLSSNQLRKESQKRFLSFMRMREWRDTHRQLKLVCKEMGLVENTQPANYAAIHQALLAGLLSHLGFLQENKEYLGARQKRFFIHPSSKISKKPPKWIMAYELVETSRLYARLVAKIDPLWAEPLAAHLVKKSHSDPHWEKKAARVVALEKVLLFGLPLVQQRKVDYGAINPVEAREIFIRSALVEGEYATRAPFMRHNQALLNEVSELEDKARKRDILVDDQLLYDFYDQRLPEIMHRGVDFEQWQRQQPAQHLFLTKEYLLARNADEVTEVAFPDQLVWEGIAWPLSYHFAPGEEDDGVSLTLPAAMLNQLPEARLEWLVPGLLEEKCMTLMRGLPKQWRKNFVPLPNYLQAALEALTADAIPLGDALGHFFYRTTGIKIPAELWSAVALPAHLQMNFKVVDAKGRLLGQGRDLTALRQRFAHEAAAHTQALDQQGLNTSGHQAWDWDTLPAKIEQSQAGITLQAFPALVDEGSSVGIQLFDTQAKAEQSYLKGLVRLMRFSLPQKEKYLSSQLPGWSELSLMFTKIGPRQALLDDLLDTSLRQTFSDQPPSAWPRTARDWQDWLDTYAPLWVAQATELAQQARAALSAQVPLAAQLKGKMPLAVALSYQDVRQQLARLFYPGFLWDAGRWIQHYPRYLRAISLRLEKAARDPRRDQHCAQEIEGLWQAWEARYQQAQQQGQVSQALLDYRWLLEEYRVSLYAQQLGTSQPVSDKRLKQLWKEALECKGF